MRLFALLTSLLLLVGCDTRSDVERANEAGILLMGNSSEPKALDPHLVSGVLESNVLRALFEGLCSGHPSQDGQSLPGAASSWTPSDDFTQWTFHLQPDGKWSDGTPVTAHDFVFAYRRLLSPDPNWPAKYSEMLYFIENAEAYHKGKLADFEQVGVHAINDYTLQVDLRGPVPFLPEITKHQTWYPVPKHIVLRHGKINTAFASPWTKQGNMVSNGPFQLKTWKTNNFVEVERNPNYWDSRNVSLNGIRYLPISNYYTETRMFSDQQLHVTDRISPELLPFARKEHPDELVTQPYVGTAFIRANTKRPPLNNPKVRLALAYAIEQEVICEKILGAGQQPAGGITPPFGNYQAPQIVHFDPDKARQLLAESGYANNSGFPDISVLIANSDTNKVIAEAIQSMWKKHLGINVRIIQREWATYIQLQNDIDYDLCTANWIGDYLDPTTFLEMWVTDGGNNRTGWSSQIYEDLLHKAENTADPAQRFSILAQAETLLMQEVPIMPVYYWTSAYLLRPEVKNWHPLLQKNPPFKHLKLEP
ncbi:MAG: peptide ABC transporter substrate-binding protein [Verrucomicrobiota bacterium]